MLPEKHFPLPGLLSPSRPRPWLNIPLLLLHACTQGGACASHARSASGTNAEFGPQLSSGARVLPVSPSRSPQPIYTFIRLDYFIISLRSPPTPILPRTVFLGETSRRRTASASSRKPAVPAPPSLCSSWGLAAGRTTGCGRTRRAATGL